MFLRSDAMQAAVAMWNWIPGIVILSQLCPEGVEATKCTTRPAPPAPPNGPLDTPDATSSVGRYAILAGSQNLGTNLAR